jgi:hypothetical protein
MMNFSLSESERRLIVKTLMAGALLYGATKEMVAQYPAVPRVRPTVAACRAYLIAASCLLVSHAVGRLTPVTTALKISFQHFSSL